MSASHRRHRALAWTGAWLLVPLGVACGADDAPPAGEPRPESFRGRWHLVSGRDAQGTFPPAAGRRVTLVVSPGEVGGTSACNLYGGTLEVHGDAVRIHEVAGTEMACAPSVMAVEERYLTALAGVDHVVSDGRDLTLSGPDVALEFERDAPVADADLVGTRWRLESTVQDDAVSSVAAPAGLRFREDGTFAATTGCGTVTGRFTVQRHTVSVTDLEGEVPAAVRCTGEAMSQRDHVIDVLGEHFTAVVRGDRLTLTAAHGRGLVFVRR